MFIKTKDNKVISVWEREVYGGWDCYFEDFVYNIVGKYYINFGLIEQIIETMQFNLKKKDFKWKMR